MDEFRRPQTALAVQSPPLVYSTCWPNGWRQAPSPMINTSRHCNSDNIAYIIYTAG